MASKDFHRVLLTGIPHRCNIQPRFFQAHSGGKMLNSMFGKVQLTTGAKDRKPWAGLARAGWVAVCVLAVAAGCKTAPPHPATAPPSQPTAAATNNVAAQPAATNNVATNSTKSLILQEGDTIKISFAGEPSMDTIQPIRRDGKITLPMIGEYDVAGKTPSALEEELKQRYAPLLVNNDVSVTVQSSAFVIYVMGAVMRPGKLVSERPLNILEALIESGIDNSKSNLKAIQVLRTDSITGKVEKSPKLNFYKYIHSKSAPMPSYTLKQYDVIVVPDRFSFIQ
jgi:polysaccharide biosynthesis/export protein